MKTAEILWRLTRQLSWPQAAVWVADARLSESRSRILRHWCTALRLHSDTAEMARRCELPRLFTDDNVILTLRIHSHIVRDTAFNSWVISTEWWPLAPAYPSFLFSGSGTTSRKLWLFLIWLYIVLSLCYSAAAAQPHENSEFFNLTFNLTWVK